MATSSQLSNTREPRWSELPQIAKVMARAFWDDNLFGDLIHPHRNQYPADPDLYWLRRAHAMWWDYRYKWLVAVVEEEDTAANGGTREVVAGIARWERLGDGGKPMECWWFDPRNLLKPLTSAAMSVHALLWPNRAADPAQEDVIERSYPFFGPITWHDERAESWYLEVLAVDPNYQGRRLGQALVAWGLERAAADDVCASVVSAAGKDGFYRKCGFDIQDGSACAGKGNPLHGVDGGNIHWRMPRKN
ncbi:hypothetical protein BX600DRAFT_157954 [Xylariales sp. PMI_506]|nr:hypothetical protein BX600DRAFT_157954 [Xylariales sp. PMI_506]